MTTREEFIQKIRSKYPQYESIEDDVLYNKIIEKYPSYKDQITNIQPEATDKSIEKSKDASDMKTLKAENKPLKSKGIPVRSNPPDVLLNLLPPAGAVTGALMGGGIGSVPLAGAGASAGEILKQAALKKAGRQEETSTEDLLRKVLRTGAAGAAGEGAGVAGGTIFSKIAPQLGKLAKIDPKRFNNILQMINRGENPFSQQVLQSKHPLLRSLIEKDIAEFSKKTPSLLPEKLTGIGAATLSGLTGGGYSGATTAGLGTAALTHALTSPRAYGLATKSYGLARRLKPGGASGVLVNDLLFSP